MSERIIRIIDECYCRGIHLQVVETQYEYGYHYVFVTNGIPGFHSTDLERVYKEYKFYVNLMKD